MFWKLARETVVTGTPIAVLMQMKGFINLEVFRLLNKNVWFFFFPTVAYTRSLLPLARLVYKQRNTTE